MRALTLIMLIATGCTGTWGASPRHTPATRAWLNGSFVAGTAAISCDIAGTMWASHGGRWDRPGTVQGTKMEEGNPIYGAHPPIGLLIGVAVADVGARLIVLRAPLPAWAKGALLAGHFAIEAKTIAENSPSVGLCGVGGYTGSMAR